MDNTAQPPFNPPSVPPAADSPMQTNETPSQSPKKGLPKMLLVVVLLLALGAAGFGGYMYFANQKKEPAAQVPVTLSPTPTVMPSEDVSYGTLTITSPKNEEVVTTPTVTITGKTFPNAEVFVNDKETKANASGDFSLPLTLDEGENTITVLSTSDTGESAEQELTVIYEPAE